MYTDHHYVSEMIPDTCASLIENEVLLIDEGSRLPLRENDPLSAVDFNGALLIARGVHDVPDTFGDYTIVRGVEWVYIEGRGLAIVATPYGGRMVSDYDLYLCSPEIDQCITEALNPPMVEDTDEHSIKAGVADLPEVTPDITVPSQSPTFTAGRSVTLGKTPQVEPHEKNTALIAARGAFIAGAGVLIAGIISYRNSTKK